MCKSFLTTLVFFDDLFKKHNGDLLDCLFEMWDLINNNSQTKYANRRRLMINEYNRIVDELNAENHFHCYKKMIY